MLIRKIWKRSRALGISLLENEKEFSKGKKRTYSPGIHGNKKRRPSQSEYGLQLKEKSKFAIIFGFREKQLKRIFEKIKSDKKKNKDMGKILFEFAKSRIDRIIFDAKLAKTKLMARQMVVHGFFMIDNGKKIKAINSPSYSLKIGEKILFKNKKRDSDFYKSICEYAQENNKNIPENIRVDFDNGEKTNSIVLTYLNYPSNSDYEEFNKKINVSLIVDWYNRLV